MSCLRIPTTRVLPLRTEVMSTAQHLCPVQPLLLLPFQGFPLVTDREVTFMGCLLCARHCSNEYAWKLYRTLDPSHAVPWQSQRSWGLGGEGGKNNLNVAPDLWLGVASCQTCFAKGGWLQVQMFNV